MPIFDKQLAKKPNHYPWTEDFKKAMRSGFWTPDEFNFSSDVQHFKTQLTKDEQQLIIRAVSAIAQIEVDVKTFWARLGDNLPHPSLAGLGITMANVEEIHNDAYEKLLEALGLEDIQEKILENPIIQGRVTYLKKHLDKVYSDDKKQYVYSLILFTLFMENISLFSQFYIILWFNKYKNVLTDTAKQVKYTTKEEQIHAMVGVKLINTIREEYPDLFDAELKNEILKASKEALRYEYVVLEWILGDYEGLYLSKDILKAFIANRFNVSLVEIGLSPIEEVDADLLNQTEWMEISVYGNAMADFFVSRPIDYARNNQPFNAEEWF